MALSGTSRRTAGEAPDRHRANPSWALAGCHMCVVRGVAQNLPAAYKQRGPVRSWCAGPGYGPFLKPWSGPATYASITPWAAADKK